MDLLGSEAKPADLESSWFKSGGNFNLGQAEYVAIKRGSALKALYYQTTMLYLTELHMPLLAVLSITYRYYSTNFPTFKPSNVPTPAANIVTDLIVSTLPLVATRRPNPSPRFDFAGTPLSANGRVEIRR